MKSESFLFFGLFLAIFHTGFWASLGGEGLEVRGSISTCSIPLCPFQCASLPQVLGSVELNRTAL